LASPAPLAAPLAALAAQLAAHLDRKKKKIDERKKYLL
jgi:hypothetical protein